MRQVFKNGFRSSLLSGISLSADRMRLLSGDLTLQITLQPDEYMLATLGVSGLYEVVKIKARDGIELVIERAQEGTTARAWPAGTPVGMTLTAGTAQRFEDGDSGGAVLDKILIGSNGEVLTAGGNVLYTS